MLLLVTVVAAFLAYHLNWIRQRHTVFTRWDAVARSDDGELAEPPGLLGLFGEQGWYELRRESATPLTAEERAELSQVKQLFPEAKVAWLVDEQHALD